MCTLALCDMGELRDDWLREPAPKPAANLQGSRALDQTASAPSPEFTPRLPTAAARAIAYLTETQVATTP